MRCWAGITSALMALLIVAALVADAQEARQGREEPQRKGMMGRGMMGRGMMGRGMMGQGMPMPDMMPMMMEMHRQHAATESQWEAAYEGIFVLRPDKLLKYDRDLKLIKSVDLPEPSTPMMHNAGEDGDEEGRRPRMPGGMGAMRQMTARMHGALPTKLAVTPDAVYVSRGSRLLKFGHDLELQKSVELPETKPMACPMCEQMMGNMERRMRGGRDE